MHEKYQPNNVLYFSENENRKGLNVDSFLPKNFRSYLKFNFTNLV